MGAKEFLSQIQKTPSLEINHEFLESETFQNIAGGLISKENFLEFMKNNDYSHFLYNYAKNRIPSQLTDFVSNDYIVLAELHEPTPDAKCRIFSNDYLLTFNSGLRDFIYRIIRAYSTRYSFKEKSEQILSFEETCQKLYDIFWWVNITKGIAFGPDYKITEEQVVIANSLSIESELFFLFHEFGHVVFDLFKKGKLNINEYPQDILQTENEELFADLVSVFILLGLSNKTKVNTSVKLNVI